jgi:hypothetical protein
MVAAFALSASLVGAASAPNPAVDARAREWFTRLQQGRIDYSQLDDDARLPLNSDVAIVISYQWSILGSPLSFDEIGTQTPAAPETGTVYVYRVGFANDVVLNFYFGLDSQGSISGLRLAPEQQ